MKGVELRRSDSTDGLFDEKDENKYKEAGKH